MIVTIADDVLQDIHLSEEDLLVDLAVFLYDKDRLSFGRARKLAGLHHLGFQEALAVRDVYIKYNVEDLETDMRTLEMMDHLANEV